MDEDLGIEAGNGRLNGQIGPGERRREGDASGGNTAADRYDGARCSGKREAQRAMV